MYVEKENVICNLTKADACCTHEQGFKHNYVQDAHTHTHTHTHITHTHTLRSLIHSLIHTHTQKTHALLFFFWLGPPPFLAGLIPADVQT